MSDDYSEYDDTLRQRPQATWSDFLKEHNNKLRRKHRQELLDELSKSATDMAHDTLHRWGHSDTDWFDVADWIQRFAKEAE